MPSDAHDRVARSGAVFHQGLEFFDAIVSRLGPDDWDRPSPNAGWTALDVLGHLGTSVRMGISVLRGEQPSYPEFARPADLVDGDPITYWRALSSEAVDALQGADLELQMETPIGPRTVGERLAFPAIDLYVHGWDIAHAAGFIVEIPNEVVAFAHANIDPIPAEMVRGPNGAFGPEVEPPPGATATDQFIAWTGRSPR